MTTTIPIAEQLTVTVPVLLFASYADAFGSKRLSLAIEAPCSVASLVERMRALPGGHVLPPNPAVAVNHHIVRPEHVVEPHDEVALIPPVAGG